MERRGGWETRGKGQVKSFNQATGALKDVSRGAPGSIMLRRILPVANRVKTKEERLAAVNELMQRSKLEILRAELRKQHQAGCLGRFPELSTQ